MSKKKRTANRLVNFIVIISLGVCILLGASSITYALVSQAKPDVIVQIDNNGKITQSGDIYANATWYPGFSKSGIVRLENNFKRIKITDLGLDVDINNINKWDPIYDSFVKNMILTISKGKLSMFDAVLVKGKSFSELLSGAENSGDTQQFFIEKGDSVDLKYDLLMDIDSGNELEDLSANVTFRVNMDEIPGPSPPDDDDDDDDKDDGDNDFIEEPDYIIPGLDGHWAHDCILALIQNDILDPDSESRIRPDDYITRAEAAVLMGRALKLEESQETDTGYVDNVPTWARGYVIATTKAKVFKGYPGNIFKAYANITREEMTAVFIRAFREDSTSDARLDFIDEADIANWAYGNVAKSVEESIVTGYAEDNTFRPKTYMTRAEAFTIVCKLMGYHELHNKKL
ncbi:MAG: S-layer homology domain-containing protein [Clostridiaceae bacterium]|jgi:hypothetical protein|nr:S-layer homology domain-containing protein [Clostridiaceae bacterium]